jgi:hypothetical protein
MALVLSIILHKGYKATKKRGILTGKSGNDGITDKPFGGLKIHSVFS